MDFNPDSRMCLPPKLSFLFGATIPHLVLEGALKE